MTKLTKLFLPLSDLFRDMDNAWDDVASQYEFKCNGCKDNCCLSLFFHHTHVEAAYLAHGFSSLPDEEQKEIAVKAEKYCKETFSLGRDAAAPVSKKIACPLLNDGKCRLYQFRPMICRMHGLPHELHKPGPQIIKGPGCDAGKFDRHKYVPFDRTPFYRRMAGIEMDFRTQTGATGKVKKTVAQILMDI
ncbi:MAG: YkgJ family cysteine cluster protein [Desulfobacterales bacterium]|nr:YkgJ family cysteine cluster protein [Desulfobacterales bacterium]